jgi:hypothetical protein
MMDLGGRKTQMVVSYLLWAEQVVVVDVVEGYLVCRAKN